MYTFAKQEYDFLASYTTRFTDIGTLFSSGHEAKMQMKIMKRNKLNSSDVLSDVILIKYAVISGWPISSG